jgi:hypothetical protein
MDGIVPDDIFLAGDREFMRRMRPGDVFVLLPGWDASEGTKAEMKLALSLGLVIAEWSAVKKKAVRLAPADGFFVLMEALA